MKGLRKMIVWKEFSFFDRIFEEIYFIIYYSVWNVNNKCYTNVRRIHWLTNLRCEFQNFARTHSPTRLMSSENTYSLSKEHCNLKYSGECKDCFFQKYFQRHLACSGHCKIFKRQNSMEFFINSFKLYISTCILYLFIKSINYFATHFNVTAYRTKPILLHDSFLLVWPRTVYIYLSHWLFVSPRIQANYRSISNHFPPVSGLWNLWLPENEIQESQYCPDFAKLADRKGA